MAKQGLIRVPYYPQLACLSTVHPHAPLVMSTLLFWMSRNQTEATYCEQRHNYQLALHLGLEYQDLVDCMQKLQQENLFISHTITIPPKERTVDAKDKFEVRLSLDFNALAALLQKYGMSIPRKLLHHAADDSFDFYDVVDDKRLPVIQSLHGHLGGAQYQAAALVVSKFLIYVNEHCDNLASSAIAPGWKLLLTVPLGKTEDEYASELAVRFLRPQEMAIDFNFTDGNFFLPCHDEIQGEVHVVKHYRKHRPSMSLAAALLLHLTTHFPELSFTSELSIEQLFPALALCHEINGQVPVLGEAYYAARNLTVRERQDETQRYIATVNALMHQGELMHQASNLAPNQAPNQATNQATNQAPLTALNHDQNQAQAPASN